jgi:hypothetical protein
MNETLMALAADVIKRLFKAEYVVLTEADVQRHMPTLLTRALGNHIAGFLAELKLCAGVEMFVNQDTGKVESIQLLVTRTPKIYRREHARLEQEFIARYADHDVQMANEINIIDHPKST